MTTETTTRTEIAARDLPLHSVSAWGVTLIPTREFGHHPAGEQPDEGVLLVSDTSGPETYVFRHATVLRGEQFRRAYNELIDVSIDRGAPWPTVRAILDAHPSTRR